MLVITLSFGLAVSALAAPLPPYVIGNIQQQFGGRVVGVSQVSEEVYQIQVLRQDGRIVIVVVGSDGRILGVEQ